MGTGISKEAKVCLKNDKWVRKKGDKFICEEPEHIWNMNTTGGKKLKGDIEKLTCLDKGEWARKNGNDVVCEKGDDILNWNTSRGKKINNIIDCLDGGNVAHIEKKQLKCLPIKGLVNLNTPNGKILDNVVKCVQDPEKWGNMQRDGNVSCKKFEELSGLQTKETNPGSEANPKVETFIGTTSIHMKILIIIICATLIYFLYINKNTVKFVKKLKNVKRRKYKLF